MTHKRKTTHADDKFLYLYLYRNQYKLSYEMLYPLKYKYVTY